MAIEFDTIQNADVPSFFSMFSGLAILIVDPKKVRILQELLAELRIARGRRVVQRRPAVVAARVEAGVVRLEGDLQTGRLAGAWGGYQPITGISGAETGGTVPYKSILLYIDYIAYNIKPSLGAYPLRPEKIGLMYGRYLQVPEVAIGHIEENRRDTIRQFKIVMKNCPFTDDLRVENCDFPWLRYIRRWYTEQTDEEIGI